MDKDTEGAARHWNEYTRRFAGRRTGMYWYELPGVLKEINRRISGSERIDWIEHCVGKHLTRRPVDRCLSLGCGAGGLERKLAALDAFRACDAYDVSPESIRTARELAARQGLANIRYEVADVNRLELPEARYDMAWLYGSLHHLEALENVLRRLCRCLKPGGLLAFNEYVGPARFQFPERQKEIVGHCLKLLPLRYRRIVDEAVAREAEKAGRAQRESAARGRPASGSGALETVRKWFHPSPRPAESPPDEPAPPPDPVYRREAGFPEARDVAAEDPSESVRSDEIMPLLRQSFEIVEEIRWGGNVPQFLLSGIAGNFRDEDPCAQALLEMIWKIDETLLGCGEFESDFAYVVARPLRGSVAE